MANKRPRLVVVEWEDAYIISGEWMTDEKREKRMEADRFFCFSTGWLIRDDEVCVGLVQTAQRGALFNPSDTEEQSRQTQGLFCIPRGMVRRVYRVHDPIPAGGK